MKINNCYLKYQTTDLSVSLQPVEKSLSQTCYENRYVTLNETARTLKLCDCSVELFENFNSRDHEQFVQKTALTVDVNYEKVKHILPQRVINLLTDDLLCIICQKNLVLNFKKQIIEMYLWICPVKLLVDGNICKKLKNYKQKIM